MIDFSGFNTYFAQTEGKIIFLIQHAQRIRELNENVGFYFPDDTQVPVTPMSNNGVMELFPAPKFDPKAKGIRMIFTYSAKLPTEHIYGGHVHFSIWRDEMSIEGQEPVNISATHLYEYIASQFPGAEYKDS